MIFSVGSIVKMRLLDASGRQLNLADYKLERFVLEVVERENGKTTGKFMTVITSAIFAPVVTVDADTEAGREQQRQAKTRTTYQVSPPWKVEEEGLL